MSTNATSADPGGSLSVSTDVLTEAFVPAEPPAGRRNSQLRRQLLSADIIAGSFTGAIAALAAGLSFNKLPVVALAIGLGWPVLAYVCGLYALDDQGRVAFMNSAADASSWPCCARIAGSMASRRM